MPEREKTVAVGALVTGAVVWGLIWYPYRALEAAGLGGLWSTTLTYGVALIAGGACWRKTLRQFRPSWMLAAIGLASGGCNFGYVLATLHGEVMRVLLLFYLAPLWTVLLSRVLLGERLNGAGGVVILLSLAGAVTMLWHPALGMPLPMNVAEWLGLAAGFLFALSNVLIRRAHAHSIELKSLAVFAGVTVLGLAGAPFAPWPEAARIGPVVWPVVRVVGLVLMAVNVVVQHGLMRVPANRAIVIMLFELVVAAASSWWLAGELIGLREWLGGAMIVAASVLSGVMEARAAAGAVAPTQA